MAWDLIQTPQAQLYDLPFIGNDIAKVGRIIDLWSDPCSPSPTIWVYGFFQEIPTLFVTLTKPELYDTNIKKGGHRPRKGKRARFRASAIFRDALIEIPTPRWVVFRIYEMYQRVGWYFLVADATENFALNWLSMAYIYNGCVSPNIAYSHKQASSFLQGTTPATGVPLRWNQVAASQMDNTVQGMRPIKPGTYRFQYSAFFRPYGVPTLGAIPYDTWLSIDGERAGNSLNDPIDGGQLFGGGGAALKIHGPPYPLVTVNAAYPQSGKFTLVSGTFEGARIESGQLGPDP